MPKKKNYDEYEYDDDDGDTNAALFQFTDPATRKPFRSTFIQAASLFMSKEDIAGIFNVDQKTLEKLCLKEFSGQTADEVIATCRASAHMKTNATLRRLMANGNNTATNIYTTYVDKLQQAQQQNNLTIKVVGQVPDDSDDDGGVSLSLPDSGKKEAR